MQLSICLLNERHAFWKERIHKEGIWDASRFLPVNISIRPPSKCYNGKFIRKMKRRNGSLIPFDRIFIYDNNGDTDLRFIDSILVHEMIHQYIIQNKIKDTSSHGALFRDFMKKINQTFPNELKINIRDTNPSIPLRGEGIETHTLLLLQMENRVCYCAVINPSRKRHFQQMLEKEARNLQLRNYSWAESSDVYFNRFRRCTKSLHGIKKTTPEMIEFCNQFKVKIQNPFF